MNKPRLASLLLLTSAMTAPATAWAQDSTPAPDATAQPAADGQSPGAQADAGQDQAPEVSLPGGPIVVTGRRNANVQRVSTEVVSVLSAAEIARTGEGDISGALSHVTGLSVVGNGYVYVRGLGDRYSLALLNGSPLPSPEPLKRVVPLDLFPTDIVASSLVQKSYSVNFPGEFGGGVINLTTQSVPSESFLKIGGGIGWDTETTNKLGYSYYGGKQDWTGFDNGAHGIPTTLQNYFDSNQVLVEGSDLAKTLGGALINGRNAVVQKIGHEQPNFSANLSAGTAIDLTGGTLGVIAAAGYSNKTITRDILQQRTSLTTASDPNSLYSNFRTVQTDNRIVANALLGLGLQLGESKIRWTNVYIHDTDKLASLSLGQVPTYSTTTDYMNQKTAWFERQLIDTQFVGEFKVASDTEIDVRGGYANSKRLAPYEIDIQYYRSNLDTAVDPFGNMFVNTPGYQNVDPTSVKFSRLNENVWSGSWDVSHTFAPGWTGAFGYAFQRNSRTNSRRNFIYQVTGADFLIKSIGALRPDVLYQPGTFYLSDAGEKYNLSMTETETQTAVFDASLRTHAFYAKLDGTITDALTFDLGMRWEDAKEATSVTAIGGATTAYEPLKNAYWLPAITLTYEIQPGMQVRLSASKTIARPQFRELVNQPFYDPESSRAYKGNPYLQDSQLYNAEGRFEWYFGRDERLSLGAFFKRIDHPIETFVSDSESFTTSYANAPKANLYGIELEAQKYFPLFASRRLLVGGNYTYSKSKLKVGAGDYTRVFGQSGIPGLPSGTTYASTYFVDGAPLTGQSEHIGNLQIGLEDRDSLSQQTLMLNYASKRTISRGLYGTGQPDVVENPGLTIDVVIRQGFTVMGKEFEVKLEGRNLTGRRHEEYQQFSDGSRVDWNTYNVGRVFSASASVKF